MNVIFLAVAQQELDDAVEYYNQTAQGLGDGLLAEFFAAIERIHALPDAWPPFIAGTRRCLLNRFPYGEIYLHEKDVLLIAAVAHLHRGPDYWVDRLVSCLRNTFNNCYVKKTVRSRVPNRSLLVLDTLFSVGE